MILWRSDVCKAKDGKFRRATGSEGALTLQRFPAKQNWGDCRILAYVTFADISAAKKVRLVVETIRTRAWVNPDLLLVQGTLATPVKMPACQYHQYCKRLFGSTHNFTFIFACWRNLTLKSPSPPTGQQLG